MNSTKRSVTAWSCAALPPPTVLPHARLRTAVHCYRYFSADAESKIGRVLVDSATILSFDFGSSGSDRDCHGSTVSVTPLFSGMLDTLRKSHSIGVHVIMEPWAAYTLVGDSVLNAEQSWHWDPYLRHLLRALTATANWWIRFAVLDAALVRRWEGGPPCAPLVYRTWRILTRVHGVISIPTLAAEAGRSHRQLARQFSQQIGVTPKVAARALRLRRALRLLGAGLPPAEVAVECAFYDQSHLSRECRAMTGMSPTEVARECSHGDFLQDVLWGTDENPNVGQASTRRQILEDAMIEEVMPDYEAPTLVEIGDFADLTQLTSQGYWLDSPWGAWWL
jgi:AraC-like DNA-binding protein